MKRVFCTIFIILLIGSLISLVSTGTPTVKSLSGLLEYIKVTTVDIDTSWIYDIPNIADNTPVNVFFRVVGLNSVVDLLNGILKGIRVLYVMFVAVVQCFIGISAILRYFFTGV